VESAPPEVQRDDELRYVTQHFKDLQGLRMVPFWAAFILLSALEYAHAVSRRQGPGLFLGVLALAGAWLAYAGRWYRRHYGLVTRREERMPSQVLSILQTDRRPPVAAEWWFGVCALVSALYLVDRFQPRSDGRFSGLGLVGLTIFLLHKACFAGGASRPVRGRQMLAMGGIAMICVLSYGFFLGHLDPWLYTGGTATVLLLASLYDHWLLTRLLSGRFAEGQDARSMAGDRIN
jgi:hypothetical protein